MKTWKDGGAARWLWVGAAIIAVLGTGVADAKEKERNRDRDRVHSGYIGVYMQDLTDDVRKGLDLTVKEGVLVSGVADDGPAEKAGLDDGDVVVSFNGRKVATPEELRRAVRDVEPGTEATLGIVRDGKEKTLTVTVGERPEESWGWFSGEAPRAPEFRRAFAMLSGPRLGIQAHEISDELGAYFNAKGGEGVLVLEVDEESVAAKAGVQAGDIVQKIDEEKVADIDDLRASMQDFEEGDAFTITVLRHGKPQSLKATMDDQSGYEFSWFDGNGHHRGRVHAPRMESFQIPDSYHQDLKKELDELREELDELREELDSRAD